MITEKGLQKASQAIYELLGGIRVVLMNGETQTLPVYEGESDPSHIKIMGLVDDKTTGEITKIQLMDKDGDVFAERDDHLAKTEAEGLLVSFMIRILESEVL